MDSLNKLLFISSQKFDISFINLQTNTILQHLKQTITCTNHKFIQQICMRKKYKTSKHPKNIYIKKKVWKKINIFKLSSNKKKW
jgi:cupin superfamily acireductone dioxygenase involved in methionine salvage